MPDELMSRGYSAANLLFFEPVVMEVGSLTSFLAGMFARRLPRISIILKWFVPAEPRSRVKRFV